MSLDKIKTYLTLKYLNVFTLLFTFMSVVLFSYYCFLTPDEYNYSNITWTSQRLTSIADIILSQKLLYTEWTGRIVVHFLTQYFLFVGKPLYDLINAVIYISFAYLAGNFISSRNQLQNTIIALFLMFFFVPMYAEKFIWLSGSLNYLWTTVIMLVMCKMYYNYIVRNTDIKLINGILLSIVSFFGGWSQENVVFVGLAFLVILLTSHFKRIYTFSRGKQLYIITGFISFGLGTLLLILAPGNFKRLGTDNNVYLNLLNILSNMKFTKDIIIILVIILFLLILLKKINEVKLLVAYFLIPACLSLLPLLLIGNIPPRAVFPFEAFIIICIIFGFNGLLDSVNSNTFKKIMLFTISIILSYQTITLLWGTVKYVKPYNRNLELAIGIAQFNNDKTFVFDKFELPVGMREKYSMMHQLPFQISNSIPNTYFSTYFGFLDSHFVTKGSALINITLADEPEFNLSYKIFVRTDGENFDYNRPFYRITDYYMMPGNTLKNNLLVEIPEMLTNTIEIHFPEQHRVTIKELTYIARGEQFNLTVEEIYNKLVNRTENGIKLESDALIIDTNVVNSLQLLLKEG